MHVTGTEWTAGVGDDAAEVGVFLDKATITQSIIPYICGSTSGKKVTHL